MTVLRIERLSKHYNEQPTLDGIDLEVREGEIVSLLGPSGCGKSTLLRILAGLDQHYDGVVQVIGDGNGVTAREVGVVFQEPRLFPWLTVQQNIAFGTKTDIETVETIAATVGLEGCLKAMPKQLSGGMAQRCAIARALLTKPQLLLLDEPFSALDAFTRMQLHDLILSIRSVYQTTMLLVTHDIREALYLSDRVVVMSGRPGRVLRVIEFDQPQPRDRAGDQAIALESELLSELGYGREPLHTQNKEWVHLESS